MTTSLQPQWETLPALHLPCVRAALRHTPTPADARAQPRSMRARGWLQPCSWSRPTVTKRWLRLRYWGRLTVNKRSKRWAPTSFVGRTHRQQTAAGIRRGLRTGSPASWRATMCYLSPG